MKHYGTAITIYNQVLREAAPSKSGAQKLIIKTLHLYLHPDVAYP